MHNPETIKLRALAAEVKNYQTERGWSDARLCKEIASVGSSKTYKRILDPLDDLDQLSIENQLRNYQSAVEIVQSRRQKDRPAELEYEDFANCKNAYAAVMRASLEDQENVARLVIIEGATSTGKDCVKRFLLKKFPANAVEIEATELWKSPTTPLLTIHAALTIVKQKDKETGELPKPPRHPREILDVIINELKERKLILIINEAHHMGVPGLNIVKTIINMTPTVVVFVCIPALLTRLLGRNYEEAVQLTGNRLCERVFLSAPPKDEILLMLDRRGVKFDDIETRNDAVNRIAADAPAFGNWRFVSQIVRKLYEKKADASRANVTTAINAVKEMRTRIMKQQEG
jgi:Cdc6-like AAA superfamily ATPase